MRKADDPKRLEHIVDAARKALRFARGKKRADLEREELLTLALLKLFEIIGEAAARLSPAARQRLRTVPWPKVIGMRNRLIHNYDEVDLDILWQTLKQDLPALIASLKNVGGEPSPGRQRKKKK
jgi:uncharacterized protein with HEPN domain